MVASRLARREVAVARARASEGGRRTRRGFAWVAVWVGLVGLVVVLSTTGRLKGPWERACHLTIDRGVLDARWPEPGEHLVIWDIALFGSRATDWVLPGWGVDRSQRFVRVPVWMVFLLAGALGGTGVWRNRVRAGYCMRCDYDLRGLAANDGVVTCPECGQKCVASTSPACEARAHRMRGVWPIAAGLVISAAMVVACARGWGWWSMRGNGTYTFAEIERGALVYREMSVWSSEYVGDGVTSEMEWWRVMLPRVKWFGGLWYARVPLWPIPAALIGWGVVRRRRACRGAGRPPATPGGEGAGA